MSAVCSMYAVPSMLIFCMHGMPRLPAILAEIVCMHLKTLHSARVQMFVLPRCCSDVLCFPEHNVLHVMFHL